jgi:hypothetical protein
MQRGALGCRMQQLTMLVGELNGNQMLITSGQEMMGVRPEGASW